MFLSSQIIVIPTGETKYVSALGNDSNDGDTPATAWRTIAKVNAYAWQPGDTVRFEGGQTFSDDVLQFYNFAGTAALPLTIGSYGTGRATIAPAFNTPVYLENCSGITLKNLEIVGQNSTTTNEGGIYVYTDARKSNITIRNCVVRNTYYGIFFIAYNATNGSNIGIDNILIEDTEVYNCYHSGINTYSNRDVTGVHDFNNAIIRRCEVHDITGITGTGSNDGTGIVIGQGDGCLIEDCLVYECGASNTSASLGPVGVFTYESTGTTIRNCESHSNTAGNIDGGGFDLDVKCTNCVIEYCYSHNNKGPGFLMASTVGATGHSGNTIRYCISENDAKGGLTAPIHIYGKTDNATIHNNSVYVPSGSSALALFEVQDYAGANLLVANNIFSGPSGIQTVRDNLGTNTGTNSRFRGNCYWRTGGTFAVRWAGVTYTSMATWRTSGQETVSGSPVGVHADPLYSNPGNGGTYAIEALNTGLTAYDVTSGSPVIDAGLNLQTLFSISPGTTDFHGTTVPVNGTYDIGAIETV